MRIKIHPLFFVLALVLIAFGQALPFLWTFLALTLHELGHAFAARARGYVVHELVLLPYGALMSSDDTFDKVSSVLIGLAGPIVNVLLVFIVLGIWWLFPESYPVTQYFFYANVTLAVFNLLPVYPLDGSRVVLGLCKHRLKTLKRLKIAGIIVSFLFFALFIASAFYDINFSIGIISIFLFVGATSGTKNEMYVSIFDSTSKNYQFGVRKNEVHIAMSTPIARLYHHISSSSETVFVIVKENGEKQFEITEKQLKKLAVKNKLSMPIGLAYLKQKEKV